MRRSKLPLTLRRWRPGIGALTLSWRRRRRPGTSMDQLEWLYRKAGSKVWIRKIGGHGWKVAHYLLGCCAIVFGAVAGITVFADLAKTNQDLRILLGCLAAAGGVCGALGTFLKGDERSVQNAAEEPAWERIGDEIGRLHSRFDTLDASQQVAELMRVQEKFCDQADRDGAARAKK